MLCCCAHLDHVVLACRKRNAIELAVQQRGSAAARKSTEQAAEQAAKKGSSVGLLKVLLKEHDHDNIQMVQLAAKPLLLQELKVCLSPSLGKKRKARKGKDKTRQDKKRGKRKKQLKTIQHWEFYEGF